MAVKSFLLALLLSTGALHAAVTPTSPRAEKQIELTMGESLAEVGRNFVHVVDKARPALLTLDTATGEFRSGVKLAGVPGYGALMCTSRDEQKLFIPLTSAQKIQVLSLKDFTTIDILHVGISPNCLAMAAGDIIYATTSDGRITALNSTTGRILSTGSSLDASLIKIDSTGTRLFTMRLGISGGGNMIQEYSVANGQAPVFVRGHNPSGSANDADFEVDTTRNTLYATAGGVYGIGVWNMSTETYRFWPYDAAYGVAVAHVPDTEFVYGASGSSYDARIVRFHKDTGSKDAIFDLSPAAGYNSILHRSVQVTPNGHIFYGREGSRVGLIGIGTLGSLPEIAEIADAGPDRPLAEEEVLRLPAGEWKKVSGLGEVTFTPDGSVVVVNFPYSGEYVLEGGITSPTGTHLDRVRVTVPPAKKSVLARGALASYKVPASSADLLNAGLQWTHPAFNDSAWAKGPTGLGYERRPEGTFDQEIATSLTSLYNRNQSLLLRIPFSFSAENTRIAAMELRIEIDDGFVAYLNGVQVARYNAGSETLTWNSGATMDNPDNSALTPLVVDLTIHASAVRTGNNVLAIHALNDRIDDEEMLVTPELRIAVRETPYTVWSYGFAGFIGAAAAPLADPDQDGRPNFFEFATGSSPVRAEASTDILTPLLRLAQDQAGQARLQVIYPRRKGAENDGLLYRTLFSSDLSEGSWRYGGTLRYPTRITAVQALEDTDYELVTEQLDSSLTGESMFARVEVSWAPPE